MRKPERPATSKRSELTVTEAAHEVGVKRQAIFIAIKRGLLPSRKREIPPFGDVVFIGRQDFEAWAERSANRRRVQQAFRNQIKPCRSFPLVPLESWESRSG